MATVIVAFIGKTVASKLIGFAISKALGVEVQGATVGAWGEQFVLGIFFNKGLTPGPTFEQQVDLKFAQLEQEISTLRQDIEDLKNRMSNFEWQVQTMLYEAREEDLWQSMLEIENSTTTFYSLLDQLRTSTQDLSERQRAARALAESILSSSLTANLADTRLAIMGDNVGAGDERVRGFLEIWKQQALREADLDWQGYRLSEIYTVLEDKFTRALLIQVKCARLLMEAYEAKRLADGSQKSAVDYYADTFYPMLVEEVLGFRDIIESLAVNILPLPNVPLASLNIPGEIAGMLAAVDVFTAQALGGKIANVTAPSGGRNLQKLPALSGCWGRVIVPGMRWIRRSPGATEPARIALTGNGRTIQLGGTLEVRAVDYIPYDSQAGKKLHEGYVFYVGTEPRAMDRLLLAQFTPGDVLPLDVSGTFDVKIEDQGGSVLAQTQATVLPIPVDAAESAKLPFGTFTMSFTGGAEIRSA